MTTALLIIAGVALIAAALAHARLLDRAAMLADEREQAEAAANYWKAAHDKGVAAWKRRALDAETAIEQMHAEVRRVEDNAHVSLSLVLAEVEELAAYKMPADPAWTDGAETMRGAVVRLLNGWKADEVAS